jgi:hypothetical protein
MDESLAKENAYNNNMIYDLKNDWKLISIVQFGKKTNLYLKINDFLKLKFA